MSENLAFEQKMLQKQLANMMEKGEVFEIQIAVLNGALESKQGESEEAKKSHSAICQELEGKRGG